MSKQTKQIQQPRQHRLSIQPKEEKESNRRTPTQALEGLAPDAALQLPGTASQSLRQAAVIQRQTTHGNSVVARDLEERDAGAGPIAPPSRLEGPAGSVSVSGGVAEINAPAIALKAPTVTLNGMLVGGHVMSDQVMSSGNVTSSGNMESAGDMRATGDVQSVKVMAAESVSSAGTVTSAGNMTSLGAMSAMLGVSTPGDAQSTRVITQDIPGWPKEKD